MTTKNTSQASGKTSSVELVDCDECGLPVRKSSLGLHQWKAHEIDRRAPVEDDDEELEDEEDEDTEDEEDDEEEDEEDEEDEDKTPRKRAANKKKAHTTSRRVKAPKKKKVPNKKVGDKKEKRQTGFLGAWK